MLGIGGDGAEGLGGRAKEDAVDLRFVLEGDGRDVGGYGKDDVNHREENRRDGQLPLIGQVDLIGANLRRPQAFRRLLEVTCEPRDLLLVRRLGVRGEIPHLHVLEHASAKRGHGSLPCEKSLVHSRISHWSVREDPDQRFTWERRLGRARRSDDRFTASREAG
jgi:hypothetical protein